MKLPKTLPQWLGALLIVFVIYAVFSDPTGSADVTGTAWGTIKDGFGSVTTFFDTLISS